MQTNTFTPLEHFSVDILALLNFNLGPLYLIMTVDTFFLFSLSVMPLYIGLCLCFSNPSVANSVGILGYYFINFYKIILNLIKTQIPGIRASKYFILVSVVVIYIAILNFFSLSSYTNSITSHFIFTFFLSLSLFGGVIINGLLNLRIEFSRLFYPSGINEILSNGLVIIELISFLIRPFSLGIRLFANMLAGHTLLNIFSTFAVFISQNYLVLFIVPFIFCLLIMFLEVGVSIIQAYVFVVLLLIYLSDVTKINH